jgi:hypothetical protein
MEEIEQTQPTQPAQPTPEQLMKELEAWLAERNAVIVPVAWGQDKSTRQHRGLGN